MEIAFMSNENKETKIVYFDDKKLVEKFLKKGYKVDFIANVTFSSDSEEEVKTAVRVTEFIARRGLTISNMANVKITEELIADECKGIFGDNFIEEIFEESKNIKSDNVKNKRFKDIAAK